MILKANNVWETVLGYTEAELQNASFFHFVHGDDISKTRNLMNHNLSSNNTYNFANCMLHIDGTTRNIEWRARMYGEYIYATGRDVTEKQLYQKQIAEREDNFSILFNTIDDLLFVADEQGHIFHVNQAVINKLRYSYQELLSLTILDVHPEPYREEALGIFKDMFSGLRSNCPLPLLRKDGSYLPVETRVWFGTWYGKKCLYGISKDLTKQQQALDKFEKLFNNNPALMAVSDNATHKFTNVNIAFLTKLGYRRDEVIGKNSEELNLFLESDKHKEAALELTKNGIIQDVELQARRKNGDILEGLFSGIILDNQGDKDLLTVAIDLTELKKVERELRESEMRLNLATSNANIVLWDWNIPKNHTIFNDQFEMITGLSTKDNQDTRLTWRRLVHPDDQSSASEALLSHFNEKTDSFSCEIRIMDKAGKWIWVLQRGRVIERDPQRRPIRMVGTLIDIDERKNAEESIKKNEIIVTAVAMSIKTLIENRCYLDAIEDCFNLIGRAAAVDRVYLFVNRYDDNGRGFTSQKIEWSSVTNQSQLNNPDLQDLPFEDVEGFMTPLINGSEFCGIVRLMDNDKVKVLLQAQDVLSIIVLPIHVRGILWGYVGFDECKYERIWTQTEYSTLAAFASSIGKTVERDLIENDLKAAKKSAEEANMLKSQFLSNMSHEIRTPMHAIMGYSSLLRDSNDAVQSLNYVSSIQKAGENLLKLIDDILDISKIESGQLVLHAEPVDIIRMFEDIHSVFVMKIREKSLSLHFDISPEVPQQMILDEVRIRQILFNLVGNAIKFTDKGSISVSAQVNETDLINNTLDLIFVIQDTGIGIPSSEQENIFEPFRQREGQSSKKYGGTGLGLSISRKLALIMGGSITLKSEPGEGSTFTVFLPGIKYIREMERSGSTPASNVENNDLVSDFSKKLVSKPVSSDMLHELKQFEDEYLDICIKQSRMKDIRRFSDALINTGNKYSHEETINYGKDLRLLADKYDLKQIKEMLMNYPDMLEKISVLD